jgi:hypothetical protein
MMERIEIESLRLLCPELADELVGCEALEGLESPREVAGCDEVAEMRSQLIVCFVIVALDDRVLEGPVHPFDLAISPGMLRFC